MRGRQLLTPAASVLPGSAATTEGCITGGYISKPWHLDAQMTFSLTAGRLHHQFEESQEPRHPCQGKLSAHCPIAASRQSTFVLLPSCLQGLGAMQVLPWISSSQPPRCIQHDCFALRKPVPWVTQGVHKELTGCLHSACRD